jgi:superfamily II DNA/RNA helicase
MLNLVEGCLKTLNASWVRLDGSVPQAKRRFIIKQFTDDPKIRIFLCTNAGATGLNLQAADTVINLDLPWNPAVLEQRIGRAHRMGQTKSVQVFLLITKDTIEEKLLDLLGAKSALALAALDLDSDVDSVAMTTGLDALKQRLEILLGRRPDKPIEEEAQPEDAVQDHRHKVLSAGEKLKKAALELLELFAPPKEEPASEASPDGAETPAVRPAEQPGPAQFISGLLANFTEKDADGRTRLVLPVPDANVIEKAAASIGQLLGQFFK